MKKIYTASASDIVKAMYGEPKATEESIEFGKKAEVIIQQALYYSNRISDIDVLWSNPLDENLEGLNEDEIVECSFCDALMSPYGEYFISDDGDCYCHDCYRNKLMYDLSLEDNKIFKMFVYFRKMFLFETIKTPKTMFREKGKNRRIYAKGDLYVEDKDIIVEFKTYPKNKYAIQQAKIMSWVYQKPVLLVCFSFSGIGKMKIQKTLIKNVKRIRLPKNLKWKKQEIDENEDDDDDDYDYIDYDFDEDEEEL